jgi:hypothetical protein
MENQITKSEQRAKIEEMKLNMKPTMWHHIDFIDYKKRSRKATVCGVVYSDKEDVKHLKIGIAKCSVNDSFCKETGRNVSRVKACQKPDHVIEFTENDDRKIKKEMIKFAEIFILEHNLDSEIVKKKID